MNKNSFLNLIVLIFAASCSHKISVGTLSEDGAFAAKRERIDFESGLASEHGGHARVTCSFAKSEEDPNQVKFALEFIETFLGIRESCYFHPDCVGSADIKTLMKDIETHKKVTIAKFPKSFHPQLKRIGLFIPRLKKFFEYAEIDSDGKMVLTVDLSNNVALKEDLKTIAIEFSLQKEELITFEKKWDKQCVWEYSQFFEKKGKKST